MTAVDLQKWRVNLICSCNNDLAYGYGPTKMVAIANAWRYFRKEHPKDKPTEEIIECVAADGSHYEEVYSREL